MNVTPKRAIVYAHVHSVCTHQRWKIYRKITSRSHNMVIWIYSLKEGRSLLVIFCNIHQTNVSNQCTIHTADRIKSSIFIRMIISDILSASKSIWCYNYALLNKRRTSLKFDSDYCTWTCVFFLIVFERFEYLQAHSEYVWFDHLDFFMVHLS